MCYVEWIQTSSRMTRGSRSPFISNGSYWSPRCVHSVTITLLIQNGELHAGLSSQNRNVLEYRKAFIKPLSQVQTWLLQHLAYNSFNGLDNTDQIDLWPFLALPDGPTKRDGNRSRVSRHITLALEICGPTTTSYQLSRDKHFELSNQMIVMYMLLPHIRSVWLACTDMLGRYAITKERYAAAFLRISRFLLQLPASKYAEVLSDTPHHERLSGSMFVARMALSELLDLIPHTVYQYFLVLHMFSAIIPHPRPEEGGRNPLGAAIRYLNMVRAQKSCRCINITNFNHTPCLETDAGGVSPPE